MEYYRRYYADAAKPAEALRGFTATQIVLANEAHTKVVNDNLDAQFAEVRRRLERERAQDWQAKRGADTRERFNGICEKRGGRT